MARITYFGYARNAEGKVEQVRVTTDGPHARTRQEWTGVIYKNDREAARDIERIHATHNFYKEG